MNKPEFVKLITNTREVLERNFSSDTAFQNIKSSIPSKGHCAVVSVIVYLKFGGELCSTKVNNISHWYNRVEVDGKFFDIDLTGDQFGYKKIQIKPRNKLYEGSKTREISEINNETLLRAKLLAQKSNFDIITEEIEQLLKQHNAGK